MRDETHFEGFAGATAETSKLSLTPAKLKCEVILTNTINTASGVGLRVSVYAVMSKRSTKSTPNHLCPSQAFGCRTVV